MRKLVISRALVQFVACVLHQCCFSIRWFIQNSIIFSPNCMCETFFAQACLTNRVTMELINCSVCYELPTIIRSLKMNLFGLVMMLEILSMSSQSHATESLWSPVLFSSFANSFRKIHCKALYFMDEVCLYSLYSINVRLSSVLSVLAL
jgi:hypothetical protein